MATASNPKRSPSSSKEYRSGICGRIFDSAERHHLMEQVLYPKRKGSVICRTRRRSEKYAFPASQSNKRRQKLQMGSRNSGKHIMNSKKLRILKQKHLESLLMKQKTTGNVEQVQEFFSHFDLGTDDESIRLVDRQISLGHETSPLVSAASLILMRNIQKIKKMKVRELLVVFIQV